MNTTLFTDEKIEYRQVLREAAEFGRLQEAGPCVDAGEPGRCEREALCECQGRNSVTGITNPLSESEWICGFNNF